MDELFSNQTRTPCGSERHATGDVMEEEFRLDVVHADGRVLAREFFTTDPRDPDGVMADAARRLGVLADRLAKEKSIARDPEALGGSVYCDNGWGREEFYDVVLLPPEYIGWIQCSDQSK